MITLYLRKTTGKGQKIQIQNNSTVEQLITHIRRVFKYDEETGDDVRVDGKQSSADMFFKGLKLSENISSSIESLGITSNSIIHVVEELPEVPSEDSQVQQLNFKLILDNKLLEYSIDYDKSVSNLKEIICNDLEVRDQDLTLSHLGLELDSKKSVRECNFGNDVLLSGSVNGVINTNNFRRAYSLSRESYSQESDGIPKIVRESPSKKKLKKTESLNVEASDARMRNNINFCSMRLNKIQQKNDQSRNDSQINESQQISQQVEDMEDIEQLKWSKPKLTLESLSKPWFGDQKVIETESIVGDDQQESIYSECYLELTRIDKKRQYVLQCNGDDSFEDALAVVASLEKVQKRNIKFLMTFDQVSKSGISIRSGKGIPKSPRSTQSLKKHRNSMEGGKLLSGSQVKVEGMKMKIVQKAARMKTKTLSIQFQVIRQVFLDI